MSRPDDEQRKKPSLTDKFFGRKKRANDSATGLTLSAKPSFIDRFRGREQRLGASIPTAGSSSSVSAESIGTGNQDAAQAGETSAAGTGKPIISSHASTTT